MNWDDLRYILAVTNAGSIKGGAKQLLVNPTTVSRRLKSLEDQTGVRLFEKLRDGVVLTEAGETIVGAADQIQGLTNDLSAKIQGLDSQLSGSIRITSIESLLNLWMPDIYQFRQRYPKIQLELLSSYTLANLTKREADIAIRMSPKAPPHLVGRRYAEIYFAIYASRKLAEATEQPHCYESYSWVSWDLSVARATDNYIQSQVSDATLSMRVDKMEVLVRAVQCGMGISILPCFIGDRCDDMVRVGDYFEGDTYLWMLTHPDLRFTGRVRAFKEFMREAIERDLDLIEGRRRWISLI